MLRRVPAFVRSVTPRHRRWLAIEYFALFLISQPLRGLATPADRTDTPGPEASAPLPAFDQLWNFRDPAATEAAFAEILPLAESADNRSYRLELLTQIARAQGLQARFVDAHETLDRVESALTGDLPRARVRYLLERGRAHNAIPGGPGPSPEQRRKLAAPLFEAAFQLAQVEGLDAYALDAAHMMGIVEPADTALAWSFRAIEIAEASQNPEARGWLGPLYNNTGWTLFKAARYEEALDLFVKCEVFHRTSKAGSSPHLIARWSVAKAQRVLGRVEVALREQESLRDTRTAAGEPSGYVFEELGECLLALDRARDAAPWFARAHEVLSQDVWLAENEPERLSRLEELGQGDR